MTGHPRKRHVVVVGIGFAGLACARGLANLPDVLVTVVDKTNHHLFQPLLYQIAIAGLEAPEIAEPARALLRNSHNVRFRMGAASAVELDAGTVRIEDRLVRFDYLAICTGSTTATFGIPGVEEHALEMKTLDQALTIRDHILSACEAATREADPDRRRALLTFVIVGGGATGVELAGALAELRLHVLPRDYPEIGRDEFRVIMIESTDQPLQSMSSKLRDYTSRTLESHFQVDMINGTRVVEVQKDGVVTNTGDRIDAYTVVWTAGITGATISGLPEPVAGGRIETEPTLSLPGYPNVYVAGDLNGAASPDGSFYPQLGQTAVQQGTLVARNIRRSIAGQTQLPFRYHDKGVLVTIGRNKGVAEVSGVEITGLLAWLAWLGVHLMLLVGFRNRLLVLASWIYSYVTYDFAVRVIRQRRQFSGGGQRSRA